MSDRFIALVRHGEVMGGPRFRGPSGEPLTPRGRIQLDRVLAQSGGWDQLVASPSRRCREPAAELAKRLGVSLRVDPEFAERGFGDWHGRHATEIPASDLARFYADPTEITPPGAEPLDGFAARVRRAWSRLLAGSSGDTLLLTHGGVVRVIIGLVLDMPMRAVGLVEVPYACHTRIRVPSPPGRPSLMSHGEAP